MNRQDAKGDSGVDYGSSGINILWPKVNNEHYKAELKNAAEG